MVATGKDECSSLWQEIFKRVDKRFLLTFFFFFFLSLLFSSYHRLEDGEALKWTRAAAAEAEAVARVSCSGHGRAFLDGELSLEGQPMCECSACYHGADCSELSPDCAADADSADPLYTEPFWMERAGLSAVLISGWHRMSYEMADGGIQSARLERIIRELHDAVGNAVTQQGRYIVFGDGSFQLLNAAVHALSSATGRGGAPTKVVAAAPYYWDYATQTQFFTSQNFEWKGDAHPWKSDAMNPNVESSSFIEFVTSPNNPDGLRHSPVLRGPNVKLIYDHAYYWPQYTAITEPSDQDIMLFSMSKLTGHGGTRFGWAIVKDKGVYERMLKYIKRNTFLVAYESQLRALKVLSVLLENNGSEFFRFGYQTMRNRWLTMESIFNDSDRFSLQKLPPQQHCNFFQTATDPSPASAWVECKKEEDADCAAALADAGIKGRSGSFFGSDARYARLSLIRSQDDFNLLVDKLRALFSEDLRSAE